MRQGTTCLAKRFPSWAKNDFGEGEEGWAEQAEYLVRGIGGETKQALMQSGTPKMGLAEEVCDQISDAELEDALGKASHTPPDFCKDASV